MAGVHAGRRVTCVLAALGLLLLSVPRAQAVEALDGRIQAHGFLEMQIRGLSRDFGEELDLAQWYNVVNVELEFDILPDGWGPFDLLQAYVRAEFRFDCIYYNACGIFPSAKTYGNKSRNLPLRLRDARDEDYAGVIESNDQATPPGDDVLRVPEPGSLPLKGDEERNPTGWAVDTITPLPVNEPFDTSYEAGVDYDPLLDNAEAPKNPAPPPSGPQDKLPEYARNQSPPTSTFCPTNGKTGSLAEPIGCYTNRPELFELEKRRGFPGFDTIFDINGADGELGPNPDYSIMRDLASDPLLPPDRELLADPNRTVNDLRGLSPWAQAPPGDEDWTRERRTQQYEQAFRGLALERDDPAYYAFGVTVNTEIIRPGEVDAIDPEKFKENPGALQDLAKQIVYGESGDPLDPNCVGGYCEEIRDAGRLYTLDPMLDWQFTFRDKTGPAGGTGRTLIMGPWLPKNFFGSLAAASDRANPFRGRETPTKNIRDPNDDGDARFAGHRYHILDVASGAFDWSGTNPDPSVRGCDSDTGLCPYGPDPVDPRLLKLEQLLIAALEDNVLIGGHPPGPGHGKPAQRNWFGAYPNKHFDKSFGGDFSGIVPRWNTFTSRPTFGAALKKTPFLSQISVSNIGTLDPDSDFDSVSNAETIAYTNVRVTGGEGELPMRPAPDRSNLLTLDPLQAQGLYVPSRGLVDALQSMDLDEHEFNISQIDRALNHGASQSDTYELKEAYLDMEFLDSRLWVRAGIQNIVWGKTELFRTTDQFNPQDLAIASLPGLEESRIGLLSARAVFSFYDVGPLEDVRFELAANFDRIKPADLGACGEPYTFDVVCQATLGLALHSLAGIGLAGVDRPPSGWDDVKGIEFGGRIEFRWDRFSFAITDFYGYNDLPYPDPIFFYERSVDPNTGRPLKVGRGLRKAGEWGRCENAAGFEKGHRPLDPVRLLHAGNPVREFIDGDASAAPTGENTPINIDNDYKRWPWAYTVLGVGIDEACLKPGGAPGYPNENRFDPSMAPNSDDFPEGSYGNYIAATLGQWSLKRPEGSSTDYALAYQPANQQFFAALCSATITVAVSLSPGSCGFNIFGSGAKLITLENVETIPFAEYFALLVSGSVDKAWQNEVGWRLIIQNTKANRDSRGFVPTSPMNRDVRDGMVTSSNGLAVQGGVATNKNPWNDDNWLSFDSTLTSEQSALLGCGPFFGTRCDSGAAGAPYLDWFPAPGYQPNPFWLFGEGGGFDPLNAEASAVLQGFPGTEGTELTRDNSNYAWHADAVASADVLKRLDNETEPQTTAAVEYAGDVELRAWLEALPSLDPGKIDAIVQKFIDDYTVPVREGMINSLKTRMDNYFVVGPNARSSPPSEGTTVRDIAGGGTPGTPNTGYVIPMGGILPEDIELPDEVTLKDRQDFNQNRFTDAQYDLTEDLQDTELGIGEVEQTGYPRPVEGLGRFVGGSNDDDYVLDTWATWTDDLQPGTIGFEGMEYCTRYAPDSPYANEAGIVRLPGCRGAKSVTVNHEVVTWEKIPEIGGRPPTLETGPTIDVVFEKHYTPRQDGCIFSEYMQARDGTWYSVRAVNEDGSTGGEAERINAELLVTCFAAINDFNNPTGTTRQGRNPVFPFIEQTTRSLRSTHRWTGEFDRSDKETWPYIGTTQAVLGSRTLFHPLAGCENAGPDLRGRDTWLPPDAGFLCEFRTRDYEGDFIEGHAQVFRNEIASWSWNMLMFLMVTSCNNASGGDDLSDSDCFDPELAWDVTRCSFSTPQYCRNVKSFLAIGATNRNHVLAGGNARFGRRDFLWHSGGEAVLRYARRNVFGFSMDFAEDVSKTNWGLEFTWFGDMPFMNNNSWAAITDSQTLNLTISVDRPTFINFLNANRTFFFNTQWFFQYLLNYDKGFTGTTGPFNVLFTFAFFTGYFQDRLLPQMVTVYDFRSQSGGFLPHIQYRFNERFSVTIGINYWIGRGQYIPMPMRGLAPVSNRSGAHAYQDGAEFLISNFRHRDEAYMRIRWTF